MSLANQLLQFLITGVSVGMVYGLVGLGLTVIFNATGIINFAQGELVMLGGMVAAALAAAGLPLAGAVALSVCIVTALGLLLHRVVVHPMRKRPVMTVIIATIGASLVLQGGAKLIWGPDSVNLPAFSGDQPIAIGEGGVEPQHLWIVGLAALALVVVHGFFSFTLTGKAMRAAAGNPAAARLCGVSTDGMVRLAFAMSAALAALAGATVMPVQYMQYSQGTGYTLTGFLAAVMGGLGSGFGAVVGGITLGVLESLAKGFLSSGYARAIALGVALVVLWLRPQGLLGRGGRKA